MHNHKPLDEVIREMKAFGRHLMPFNYPMVMQSEEEEINYIKAREVCVDGYSVVVHYSKGDYQDYYLETLQVLSKHCPFLPFNVVCKVGRRCFGDDHLSLVELFRDSRKIYCWTKVTDRTGQAIPGPYTNEKDLEDRNYEGLSFRRIQNSSVNFY